MNKQQIIDKLKELGIITENCYPKNSFLKDGLPVVGCYKRELNEDFYFYNGYNKAIYKVPFKVINPWLFDGLTEKYIIPDCDWELIWEDKPYVELEDVPYRDMTLRQFACITLGIPQTGVVWLDELIKKKDDKR